MKFINFDDIVSKNEDNYDNKTYLPLSILVIVVL